MGFIVMWLLVIVAIGVSLGVMWGGFKVIERFSDTFPEPYDFYILITLYILFGSLLVTLINYPW